MRGEGKARIIITMSIGFYLSGLMRCNMRIYARMLARILSFVRFKCGILANQFCLAHFCISKSACTILCAVCQITDLIFKIALAFTFISIIVSIVHFRTSNTIIISWLVFIDKFKSNDKKLFTSKNCSYWNRNNI